MMTLSHTCRKYPTVKHLSGCGLVHSVFFLNQFPLQRRITERSSTSPQSSVALRVVQIGDHQRGVGFVVAMCLRIPR